jgi:ribosome-binding factor A
MTGLVWKGELALAAGRVDRMAEAIKQEVADILANEIKDPRVGFTSITRVELSRDMRYAKVFVSILGSDEEKEQTMKALEKANGFIRSEVAKRIRVRFAPAISLHLDNSIEYGVKIGKIIADLNKDAVKDKLTDE